MRWLFFILLVGCQPTPTVCTVNLSLEYDVRQLLNEFAERRIFHRDYETICSLDFKTLSSDVHGITQYYTDRRDIYLQPYLVDDMRDAVLYHEVWHALFDGDHTSDHGQVTSVYVSDQYVKLYWKTMREDYFKVIGDRQL